MVSLFTKEIIFRKILIEIKQGIFKKFDNYINFLSTPLTDYYADAGTNCQNQRYR